MVAWDNADDLSHGGQMSVTESSAEGLQFFRLPFRSAEQLWIDILNAEDQLK